MTDLPEPPVTDTEIFDQIERICTTYTISRLPGSPSIYQERKNIVDTMTDNPKRWTTEFNDQLVILDNMIEDFRHYQTKYFHLLR
jgi:hypothetical protein